MTRIKIKDLPKDQKITKDELKKIRGGAVFLKIEGVEGEAQDKDHKDWADISPIIWK